MKPGLCEKHGAQRFTLTSPKLSAAAVRGEWIQAAGIRKLQIVSLNKNLEYLVDCGFLREFHINIYNSTIVLKDRDKTFKQLNDRLIIQKITGRMKWVCPACLNSIVARKKCELDIGRR
jgi:hypothetical protein